ncbi:short-chain fatty acyl-CoA regulator family protein [Paracoccus sp. SCSIO 75233]|uniref:helix-turn-helix domain-containing protein n=1 Tax=Paracoccus sp. SCSIO 75233 TaxID=3017782 RepID=UPI0022F0BE25|nr:helix-turn-helix transcriptional regulator [Paracoccus sp. SCSIO 75233]WBU53362.1 short-chain fatty acyl-CoA regulator family protein [Paracoccus sp. SCSIO 75233]
MARGEKLIIGKRLKVLRTTLGLTQAQMAEQLDVSASYITLIESDQRPASAKLLMRLAQVYDINVAELAPGTDTQLAVDFEAALKDPSLETDAVSRAEMEAVLQASPRIASALVRLQGRLSDAMMRGQADDNPLTDRNKVEVLAQIAKPVELVRDWFYDNRNYMDALDREAEKVAEKNRIHRDETGTGLHRLLAAHNVRVRRLPASVMGGSLRRYDPHRKELMLSELLDAASRRFQIAVLLARLEYEDLIDEIMSQAELEGDATRSLARVSLANYFAAALLMPYQPFLAACESERYDLEVIGHRFGTSFEQTAHRMTTLQRPEARGIPFFFVRIDRAGNVSKRFSAGRFPFSRFGGTCPLWNIHAAFETPGRIQTQLIRMPEGTRYFSIARTVTRAGGSASAPAPRLAVGLGCDVAFAPRLIYADSIDQEKVQPTDIGLNCFLCERQNCASRAQAPINRNLSVNEWERSVALFSFEGE